MEPMISRTSTTFSDAVFDAFVQAWIFLVFCELACRDCITWTPKVVQVVASHECMLSLTVASQSDARESTMC